MTTTETALCDYTVVQWTQRYVLLTGAWYREAWIRDAAGVLRFVAILDSEVPA